LSLKAQIPGLFIYFKKYGAMEETCVRMRQSMPINNLRTDFTCVWSAGRQIDTFRSRLSSLDFKAKSC